MKKRTVIGCIAAVAVLIVGGSSLVVTQQNEYKLVRQFGKVNRIIDTPGSVLRFRLYSRQIPFPRKRFCMIWRPPMSSPGIKRP